MKLFFNKKEIGTLTIEDSCNNIYGLDYVFRGVNEEIIFTFSAYGHYISFVLDDLIDKVFKCKVSNDDKFVLDLEKIFEFYGYDDIYIENSSVVLFAGIYDMNENFIRFEEQGRIFVDEIYEIDYFYRIIGNDEEDDEEDDEEYDEEYDEEDNNKETKSIICFIGLLHSLCDFGNNYQYVLELRDCRRSLIKNVNF